MMKFFVLAVTLFTFSCSQMPKQMKKKPSREMNNLMESVSVENDEVFDAPREYTHEIAEANAEDTVIKKEVGGSELDEELPGSDSDKVPYSRNFLLKKNTKRMQFWVDYFTKKERARFQRFINNGEEYRHHIEQVFAEHGLPKELYFVGLIESGYYLGAKSHASAVGPWQFIKGTGRRYGLRITHELDERQDLFKASKAAAMYFKDLHNVFSSWELALSAYNAGEYGIIRRIMKHGTRDFYELSKNKQLPSETINYVPKVLAAMYVVNNAEKFGFVIPKKKHRLFDLTELKAIKKNVSLATVAKRLNVEVSLLRKLNPELKRPSTPRFSGGTYYLRVPQSRYAYRLEEIESKNETAGINRPESRKELNRRTAALNEEKSTNNLKARRHRVKKGDTLMSIARKYDVHPKEIASANNMRSWRTKLKVGQFLTLKEVKATPKLKVTKSPIVYKVRKGDNLTDLARIFDLNVSRIKTVNNLKRGKIVVGQKIILPGTQKGIYVVKHGDHLNKVAKNLNQPVEALVKLNALKRQKIYPGQKIIVNMD